MEKKRGYKALSCILAFVICMPMFFSGKAYAVEIPDRNTAMAENYWTELEVRGISGEGPVPLVRGAISFGNLFENLRLNVARPAQSVGVYKDFNTITYVNGVDEFDKYSRPELVTNDGPNGDPNYQDNRYHNPFNFDFYRDFIRDREQLNVYGDISINGNTGDREIATYKVGDKLNVEMTLDLSNLYKWEITRYWQIINGPNSGKNWETYGTDGHVGSHSAVYFKLRLPEGIGIPYNYNKEDDTYETAVKYSIEGFPDKRGHIVFDSEKDGGGEISIPISPRLGKLRTMPVKDYFNYLKRIGVVKVKMEGLVIKSDIPKNENLTFEGMITGSKSTAFFPTSVDNIIPRYEGNHDDYVFTRQFFAAKQSNIGRDKAAQPDKPNLMSFTFQVKGGPVDEALSDNVKRIAGDDRYHTSLRVGRELKKVMKGKDFNAVVVANGDNYADALSGAYLAKVKNAPLILVNENNMEQAKKFIYDHLNKRVKKWQAKSQVYLLGGERVVPEAMRTELEEYFDIKRIAGSDRFETNLKILKEADVRSGDLLVCSGVGYADSLAASASGKPIMLVDDKLSDEQKKLIKSLDRGNIKIIGGYKSVNSNIENACKSLTPTIRIYGEDRYKTSLAIAKHFFKNSKSAVFAYGDNFPDGLCGGVLAEKMNAPLLLINENNYDFAKQYVRENTMNKFVVLGGNRMIPNRTINYIVK
ncbi:MAG: cell wall-binding repeat-containing protein [[Eubacterium] sulci]|nr:cell wall-binding repeat-containing protein [[Eubacterium] sulci]